MQKLMLKSLNTVIDAENLKFFKCEKNELESQIYLFKTNLNKNDYEIKQLEIILADDEKARADKFHFECDKRRYIAARGTLRNILAKHLDCNPKEIIFKYTAVGKPYIENAQIQFNISHSHEMAVYGISFNKNIGIDIEYIGSNIRGEDVFKRYFFSSEYELIYSVPLFERQKMFFQIWTIKEAYLKATGEGIAGLEKVEVKWDKEGGNHKIYHRDGCEDAKKWVIKVLDLEYGYIGACVYEQ
jgi:4'-phosphopantetheinyl transferase